jgi:hypothetical protein
MPHHKNLSLVSTSKNHDFKDDRFSLVGSDPTYNHIRLNLPMFISQTQLSRTTLISIFFRAFNAFIITIAPDDMEELWNLICMDDRTQYTNMHLPLLHFITYGYTFPHHTASAMSASRGYSHLLILCMYNHNHLATKNEP